MIAPQTLRHRRPILSSAEQPLRTECASAHLVGICGAGMKALAEMLVGLGWSVSGSDVQTPSRTIRAMEQRGLRVHLGHNDQFLPRDVEVLVYSPAVSAENPERRLAAELNIPQMSYSRMLGWLMQNRVGVSIAGTHGKSTTTAMTASILRDAGSTPSAVFGAELCGSGVSGWAGAGELFVVESCEYQRSFLDLRPRYATITGIEPDHFDCFGDFEETQGAFADFAGRVAENGVLFVRGDCPAAVAAANTASAEVVTFSQVQGCDWWAADPRPTQFGTRFRVFHRGEFFSEISLQLPGLYNVTNALAAVAVCHRLGVSAADIRESLGEFRGIGRRFERIGWWRGVTLIDDYAHHPTAVQATLETARQMLGERRIWCAFQPHQVSRTQALMSEFAESFSSADEVLIAPVFAAREEAGPQSASVSGELASQIAAHGRPARFCPSLDRILATLEDGVRPGDVLITMGAGDINRLHHEFTRRLRRNCSAR